MMFERLTIDPTICSGKPCIRGKRFQVSQIINLIAYGVTVEQIRDDFPYLETEDIQQALLFAACLCEQKNLTLPTGSKDDDLGKVEIG